MKRGEKRWVVRLLAGVLALSMSAGALAADTGMMLRRKTEQNLPLAASSGACGEKVRWKLDGKGTLTISGTGAMKDYDYERNPSPWSDSSRIKKIVIEKGVTSVGQDAFYSCTALESVRIPGSVRSVGSYAFGLCESLTRVSLPKSVKSIGKLAFGACTELQEISVAKGTMSLR